MSSLIDHRATPEGSERRVIAFNGVLSMVVAIASSAVRRGSKAVASSHSVGSAVGIPYVTGSVGGADPALFEPGEVVHADRGEPDDLGATQV